VCSYLCSTFFHTPDCTIFPQFFYWLAPIIFVSRVDYSSLACLLASLSPSVSLCPLCPCPHQHHLTHLPLLVCVSASFFRIQSFLIHLPNSYGRFRRSSCGVPPNQILASSSSLKPLSLSLSLSLNPLTCSRFPFRSSSWHPPRSSVFPLTLTLTLTHKI
jgi:hypothetical protein